MSMNIYKKNSNSCTFNPNDNNYFPEKCYQDNTIDAFSKDSLKYNKPWEIYKKIGLGASSYFDSLYEFNPLIFYLLLTLIVLLIIMLFIIIFVFFKTLNLIKFNNNLNNFKKVPKNLIKIKKNISLLDNEIDLNQQIINSFSNLLKNKDVLIDDNLSLFSKLINA